MNTERTMQFILEQQTQFSNDIVQINTVLLDVSTTQERTNEILATLAERQILTEQSLNALLATVDRHIANHE